jgi:hypothetical protein
MLNKDNSEWFRFDLAPWISHKFYVVRTVCMSVMAFSSKRTACSYYVKRGSHGPYMSLSVHVWHGRLSGGRPIPHPLDTSSVRPFVEPNTETERIQQFSFFGSRCADTRHMRLLEYCSPSPGSPRPSFGFRNGRSGGLEQQREGPSRTPTRRISHR